MTANQVHPCVRGFTEDGVLLQGVLLENDTIVTNTFALHKLTAMVPESETKLQLHWTQIEPGCPVVVIHTNGRIAFGWFQNDGVPYVKLLNGIIWNLFDIKCAIPALCAFYGPLQHIKKNIDLQSKNLCTTSTSNGNVYLVPREFVEHEVNSWFAN